MAHPFHIVDVFAEQAYAGNQLAVVTDADDLSAETMQRIAAETNYSETTFVMRAPEDDSGWRVRLFTPARELAFAGHPILGTAWVIRRHLALASSNEVKLNLAVGQIPVSFERGKDGNEAVWFLAPPAELGPVCEPAAIAASLGISPEDIDDASPVQVLTAGVSTLIVPIRSLAALKRCMFDLDAHAPLTAQGFPSLVYLFCRETHDENNDLCVRFFFEAHGVREDPATGNGAAFLGHYLLEHGLFGDTLSLRIEQGHALRRPSLVLLRARKKEDAREVGVGGYVIPVVKGKLL